MTIPVQTPRTTTPGNGSATVFNYSFKILEAGQLAALVVDPDGTPHDPVVITNVTGVGNNAGGTFTYNPGTPLPDQATITAYLAIPIDQDEQITNQGNLYLSVIQSVLDTIVLQLQMVADQVARTPKLLANTNIGSVTMALEAGGVLYVDPLDHTQIKSTGNYGQLIGDLEDVLAIQDDIVGVNAISAEVVIVANNITAINSAYTNLAAIQAAPQAADDAADSAAAADASADLAEKWANNPEDVPVTTGPDQFSAKHWAAKAQALAQTGDYFVFSGTLTTNQATGADYITLPADPKIAARVSLALGGIAQVAGTDFALDASPNTNRLRIVGGTSALSGVKYGGVVQLPTSLTNINAPSAGSVVNATIQNGAVTANKLASDVSPAILSARGMQQFTANGNFTPGAGITRIFYEAWGGGAGGGGANGTGQASGGGAGAYASGYMDVTPGVNVAIVIGAAGVGGTSGGNGTDGGNTTITGPSLTVTAGGGIKGIGSTGFANVLGGAGGVHTNAGFGINGQAGANGQAISGVSNGAAKPYGGDAPRGGGGGKCGDINIGTSPTLVGGDGQEPGGAGGGGNSTNGNGGNGAKGRVVIYY